MRWITLGCIAALNLFITACQTSSTQLNPSMKKLDRYYLDQTIGLSSAALERHLQQAHPPFSAGPEPITSIEGEWISYRYDKVLELPIYLPASEGNRMPSGQASYQVENSCYLVFKMNHQRVETWHTTGKGCG